MNTITNDRNLTGLILAGGRSRRFGSDKALYEIEGLPMIRRVFEAISAVADPVFVSVSDPATAYDLPIRHIVDRYPDCGPLAGLHAGFRAAHTAWVLAVATDLPFVTPDLLESLIQNRSPSLDAVVARTDHRIQPLCGCYRAALADRLEARLQERELTVMGFLYSIRVKTENVTGDSLRNVNLPEDLEN